MPGGRKKNKVRYMPDYIPTEHEKQAYLYCVRNNIRISPGGGSEVDWHIDIYAGGKWNRSKEKYNRDEIWSEYYRCCLYYYDKRCAE